MSVSSIQGAGRMKAVVKKTYNLDAEMIDEIVGEWLREEC